MCVIISPLPFAWPLFTQNDGLGLSACRGRKMAKTSDVSCSRVYNITTGWSRIRMGVTLVCLVICVVQAACQLDVYDRGGRYSLEKKDSAQKPRVVVRKVQKPTACPGRCEKNRSLTWVPLHKHESDRHATTGQLKTGGSAPSYHLQCRWEVEVESAKKLSDFWCGLWLDPHRVWVPRAHWHLFLGT